MTNGDKIRELDNEGLANLIYNFIITNKNSTLFRYDEFESDIENRQKGVRFLLDIMNKEVDY